MKDEQRNQFRPAGGRESINVIYLLVKGLGACVLPFFRSNLGVDALNVPGLIAFVIIILYAGSQNARMMIGYLVVWIFLLAWKKAQARRQERQGRGEHSRYDGWPFLAMKLPFVRTEDQAKGVEPFLCFFMGVFICPLSEPVGKFFMLGAAGLVMTRMIELRTRESRVRRMRDAMIEMRQMNEDLRRRR